MVNWTFINKLFNIISPSARLLAVGRAGVFGFHLNKRLPSPSHASHHSRDQSSRPQSDKVRPRISCLFPLLGISADILIPESVMSCHTWFRIKVRSVSVPRLDPGYVLISCQFPTAGVNVTLSALNPPPIRDQDWFSLTNQARVSRCQEGVWAGNYFISVRVWLSPANSDVHFSTSTCASHSIKYFELIVSEFLSPYVF